MNKFENKADFDASTKVDHTTPLAAAANTYLAALTASSSGAKNVLNAATAFTSDMFTLAKIATHIDISRYYFLSTSRKFTSIRDAITAHESTPGSILINFANIGLYAVYTEADYITFCKNTSENFEHIQEKGRDPYVGLNMYHVMLANKRQKLVFVCDNGEYFEQLQRLAAECFKTTVRRERNQISVNIATEDERDIYKKFDSFVSYVGIHGTPEMIEAMRSIQTDRVDDYQYRRYYSVESVRIGASLEKMVEQMILDRLNSLPPVSITINGDVHGDVIAGGSKITYNTKKQVDLAAAKWIAENPPQEGEPTTDYHTRYTAAVKNPKCPTKFGPIVRESGYTTKQGLKHRYWIKKSLLVDD